MPTFPTYESKQNVNANPAAPLMSGENPVVQAGANLVKTVGSIADKWSQANDVMQLTEAKSKFMIGSSKIESEALADPDFKNSKVYQDRLAELKASSLEGIDNKMVAGKAGLDFDADAQISGIKIDAQFKGKQLKYNQVMVQNNFDGLMSKRLAATTEAEVAHYDNKMTELVAANIATGTLTYEEADKMMKDAQKTSVQYEIYADQATEEKDSAVLRDLQSKDGRYAHLNPKDKLKLIKESQDRIFQNNQTFKRQVKESAESRTNSLITDLSNQQVDLGRIDNEFAIPEELGGVNRETLRNFKKVVIQGNTDTLQRVATEGIASSYYEAFDTILDQEDRSKAMELIVKAWADGNLSLEEGAYLDSVLKETGKANPLGMAVRNVWRTVQGYKGSKEKDAGLSLHELIKRARNGIDPVIASKQILTEVAIKKNPALGLVTETPSLWLSDDGSLKEVTMKDGFLNYAEPKSSGASK
jgi:polyhydroxyalkanoate synthesis regulator phasin